VIITEFFQKYKSQTLLLYRPNRALSEICTRIRDIVLVASVEQDVKTNGIVRKYFPTYALYINTKMTLFSTHAIPFNNQMFCNTKTYLDMYCITVCHLMMVI
jgi:hypothetical protein